MTHLDKALRYAFWQHGEFTVEVAVTYTPEEEEQMLALARVSETQDEHT
jgi:beta-xylosidase